ncbi:MAG: tRNA dimethylallyltransferase [Chloroflexota bacterium]|nr:tRNA dimethylallyltransferase [Chloroflexota bacterium]
MRASVGQAAGAATGAGLATGSPPLLVIAGPTATGKTALAIRTALSLAEAGIPTEIVSADSRQVYRGLDIGTAKATVEQRAGIPHHGLDLASPDEPFSLADFVAHAQAALAGIRERDGVAILVGGTGLYLRAIARGIATDSLPADPASRAQLEAEFLAVGLEPLVERLRAIAPRRAATIDMRNPRRVVRALEITSVEGDGPLPAPRGYDGPLAWIGLSLEPAIHREWIANRARGQFDAGLIEEARALRERFDPTLPAFSAIGYREAWSVIDREASLDVAIDADVARNVAFAKRQRTWFKAEPGIRWLDPAIGDPFADAVAIASELASGVRASRIGMA